MTNKILRLPVVAPFALALFCLANSAPLSSADDHDEFEAILTQALAGDQEARGQIMQGGEDSIFALEAALSRSPEADVSKIEELVENLEADEYQVRKQATYELMGYPASIKPMLEEIAATTTSPEAKYRLVMVIESFDNRISRSDFIHNILSELYAQHIGTQLPSVVANLREDPHHERSLLYIGHVSFRDVRNALSTVDEQSRIRFILAKKYVDPSDSAVDNELRTISSELILAMAEETYWPIELEPLEQDGAYHWVTRAETLEGNRATNVIKVSIDKRDDEANSIIHFKAWQEWIYLWSYETPHRDLYNGLVLGVRGSRRARTENFRHLPEGVEVAQVRMGDREKSAWAAGRNFEWAKELIPEEYIEMLRFRENRYEPATVILSKP